MEEIKKYKIGDKIFVQKKLVLGQWKELKQVLTNLVIPGELSIKTLIKALGDDLFIVLAIILTEEGKPLQGKDISFLAKEIEYGITVEDAIEVITDFFTFNPIALLLENLKNMGATITENIRAIGLKNSAASSAAEILQSGSGSSGTSPQTMPDSGPDTLPASATNG